MSLKITVVLCSLGLLLFGSVLSQTNTVNRQTDSNVSTNTNHPSNVIKTNPNRIEAIMSPESQTATISETSKCEKNYEN